MKVLVVSNNCFAKNNPNGRILGLLFRKIPIEDVAQFYIVNGTNDFDVCNNYYIVNDSMAIKSLYSSNGIGEIVIAPQCASASWEIMSKHRAKFGRNSLTMLARNFVWSRFRWWNAKFEKWLKDFNPDILVLQCGDAPFMYEISCRISEFLKIPIVLFNTEFYYFENDNYINRNDPQFLFEYFKHKLKVAFENAMACAKMSIYNSEWLKANYDRRFGRPSEYIYQSSDYENRLITTRHVNPYIVYAGGLGYKRYEALAEIANAIYEINPEWRLTVYGMIQNEETRRLFEHTPGIDYKGIVAYEVVKNAIAESDVLVLAESQEPDMSKNTAYGFSTKITDYLFSGIPILAYGPSNNVGMNYLKDNKAAVVVFEKSLLKEKLKRLITDESFRKSISDRAIKLAHVNHDPIVNSERFISILNKVIGINKQNI